ncbi:MAG TPA: hypothetical protein VMZ27_09615, partial [Candidatus Saccharimonadales bacterium]|nr:hypothetical protein [Candidatus Saccharimonadales bacterium]
MSNYYSVEQTLELLGTLKGTVRDFATREEKLTQDLRSKLARVRQRRDDEMEVINSTLATDLATSETRHQELKKVVQTEYERRKVKIIAAHKTGKKKRLEAVDDKEGRRKHRLQTETLQTNRNHDNGLAAAEAAYANFRAELANDTTVLDNLDAQARSSFRGYKKFSALLDKPPAPKEADPTKDEYQLQSELRELMGKTEEDLRKFGKLFLPQVFRVWWLWVILLACAFAAVPLLQYFGTNSFTYTHAGIVFGAGIVLGFGLHLLGKRQGETLASKIASALGAGRNWIEVCGQKCEIRRTEELARVETEFQTRTEKIREEWGVALEEASQAREFWPKKMDEKLTTIAQRNETLRRLKSEYVEQEHAKNIEQLKSQAQSRIKELNDTCAGHEAKIQFDYDAHWQPMQVEWNSKIAPVFETIGKLNAEAEKKFQSWDAEVWKNWRAPEHFEHAAKFGRLEVDMQRLAELTPKQLKVPGAQKFSLPMLLTYPEQGCALFETNGSGREETLATLNNIVLRLLSVAPPGRLSFTVVDPVGLGQSFSGVMHLADYAEHVINNRIWTQTIQIEQKLADLNEHMEKVIQMYLRNEYKTIAEYNEQAGTIAEKYYFLVVADFPVNFSEIAAKRLMSIATSGARCGVYTLIHWDRRQPVPQDFIPEELRKNSVCVTCKGRDITLTGKFMPGTDLKLDPAPNDETATNFVHKVGISSRDSNRIEVPFAQIAPKENELWSEETTNE